MDQEIFSTYNAISKELFSIRLTMTLYSQLFCNDAETMALLDRAAGNAFAHIKHCIARDLLLSVARLCDPPESPAKGGNRKNCTFQRLTSLIESDRRRDVALSLKRRFEDEVKNRCAPLLDCRNRRLAHNDHVAKLSEISGQDIIPGVTIRDLNEIIISMRMLMADVATSYKFYNIHAVDDRAGQRAGNEVTIHGRDFKYLIKCLSEGKVPEPRSIGDLI